MFQRCVETTFESGVFSLLDDHSKYGGLVQKFGHRHYVKIGRPISE